MNRSTPIRRISAKRLKELGGKMPFSSIRPRKQFPRKGKPRSTRGISQQKKAGFSTRKTRRNSAKHPAAGLKPKSGRRVNRIVRHVRVNPISQKQRKVLARLAAIRRRWWRDSERSFTPLVCGICGLPIRNFCDLNSDHIEPGQMGGGKDNSESNLQPAHEWCNLEKGSKRNFKKAAA